MADPKIEFARERYLRATHAMQSGVAMQMALGTAATEPKHLRVGVNAAMVDASALAKLLMEKGIISEVEYYCEIADAMEREVKRYEALLSEEFDRSITLA